MTSSVRPKRSRTALFPVSVAIATAAATAMVILKLFGMPTAEAQPGGTEPAPPVISPSPKAESGSSAPAITGPEATGSATAPGGANAGSAAPAVGSGANPAPPAAEAPNNGGAPTAAGSGSGVTSPAVGGAPAAAPEVAWYDKLVQRPVDEEGNFWFPKSVNKIANESDQMYYVVLGLSIFFFAAIAFLVIYFTIKYRHRPGHKAEPSATHHDVMEITWTIIPTIIVVFLFYYGWRGYVHLVTPPVKAVEVQVQAWRWAWNFTHANGVEDSDLHVPVDVPVRLVMTSRDVLHAFYVPVMRTKQDIIPRRYTYVWFQATKPGTYRLTCAEYCGTDHSQMGRQPDGRRAVIVVHEPGGYERYLQDKGSVGGTPEEIGRSVYEKKGCAGCHTIDGGARVGPTFKGSWGTDVPLEGGGTVKMDENYIRESLMYPTAKGRPGFQRSMPSFDGQLKEKEIDGVIAFIKSLK